MKIYKKILSVSLFMFMSLAIWAETSITNLKVQGLVEPLAVEDTNPMFSWQMKSDVTGQSQKAYQIIVTNASGEKVWDSEKTESGISNNIKYSGIALKPETKYIWDLTVWDKNNVQYKASSRFETGLMSGEISAWNGAKWIGSNKLNLDAATSYYFDLTTKFRLISGNKVSFIIGANDFRFNDISQNADGIEGETYVRIEFDFSGVGTATGTIMKIYRVGYAKYDSPNNPVVTVSAANYSGTNINNLFTTDNKNKVHTINMHVENANLTFSIDGKNLYCTNTDGNGTAAVFNLAPWGQNDYYNTLFHLNSIGFAAMPASEVVYTEYKIMNCGQSVNNVVFNSDNYSIFKNLTNVTVSGSEINVKNITNVMTMDYVDPSHNALTMVRSTFNTEASKQIKSAKLYATAMGAYVMYINGKRVGNDWFAPGACQYRKILGYQSYDVTNLLTTGANGIGAILNSGWFTGYITNENYNYNFYGDNEALLAKLVITYEDGGTQTLVTNTDTWQVFKDGPIRFGNYFMGERYDANKEKAVEGWTLSNYDTSKWEQPDIITPRDWLNFKFMSRYDELIQVRETLTAKQLMPVHSKNGNSYIYNMGTNMTGVPSISIPAGWLQKGDTVIIRYAERLYPGFKGDDDYYIDTYGKSGNGLAGLTFHENYRLALCTDFYIAKDNKAVVIEPSTTYRCYQYLQITLPNSKNQLPLENVQGLVLSSDNLPTGTYLATTQDEETSKLVNQLFKNIQRSQMGNFLTIPTDCPQRNERMGWTGDAQAYCRTASYNSDVMNFFRMWMVSLRSEQGVGADWSYPGGVGFTIPSYTKEDSPDFQDGTTWGAAVCMVPWQLYTQYGNTTIIEENMNAMKLWLDGMDYFDFSSTYPHLSSKTTGLADWLALDDRTPSELVNNAIYIHMIEITAKMADVIGWSAYAETLRERHALAKEEWNKAYVDPITGKTKNVDGTIIHSQSSYATPLNFNCFSDENKPKAEAYLAKLTEKPADSGAGNMDFLPYTITTGFSGTPNILPSLSRGGYNDEAYRMFTCKDYTSWLYPVTNGATSIWEHWNGFENAFSATKSNGMNSFNHFALGAVGQWMYEFQLGITNDYLNGASGYKHFILQPTVGFGYTALSGSFDSNYGKIVSEWTADGSGNMTGYKTTVPANTTATLYLLINDQITVFNEASGVKFIKKTIHFSKPVAEYELSSGKFEFELGAGQIVVK